MAKTTTNFGLTKPERSDNYSVDIMANNMDIIDAKVAPKTETDAVEERVTALEAGNFESINAGEICGKRVGVWTTTKPYEWSFAVGDATIYTYGHKGSQESFKVTISDEYDFTNMYGWEAIDFESSEPITYTIKMDNDDYYGAGINSATVTFTDAITGNSVTETYTPSNALKDATFTKTGLSPFVKVSGTVNFRQCNVTATFSITRPVVYIKPKGT